MGVDPLGKPSVEQALCLLCHRQGWAKRAPRGEAAAAGVSVSSAGARGGLFSGCGKGVDVSHALPLLFPCFLNRARSSF